ETGVGLLQFDGQGHLTANVTLNATGASPSALTLTGTYSLASNCTGSASLTDSSSNSYVMSLSISDATKLFSSNVIASLARSSKFIVNGNAHAIYGQPTSDLVIPKVWRLLNDGEKGDRA